MRVFYSLNDFLRSRASSKKFAVTIGVFDGLHRGHQKIVKMLKKKARGHGLSTMVITFSPHPDNVLPRAKKVPMLISLKHRLRLLTEAGIDYTVVLHFTEKFSRMDAGDFIKKILARINVKEIITGSDFFFGRKRQGSPEALKKLSGFYDYGVSVVSGLRSSGEVISSTRIRGLIWKGELKKASGLLMRPVSILGTVVKGHKRGRIMGFPTANINPHHEVIPPAGVYAVKIKLGEKKYKGILNIGTSPTFAGRLPGGREPGIEVHIFDFKRCIYGRDLEIGFAGRIRSERRFSSPARLSEQIKRDEKRARRILH